jgi:hypothetical protein
MVTVKHCALLLFCATALGAVAPSQTTKRRALEHLDTVVFLMEDLSPEAEEVGFRERQVKDSFVKHLKDLGLKVLLATAETGEVIGKMAAPPPIFSPEIVVHKKKDGSFFGNIRLSLMEKGELLRLRDSTQVVTTFHYEGTYAAPAAAEMHAGLREEIRKGWDQFARGYHLANPPKKLDLPPVEPK